MQNTENPRTTTEAQINANRENAKKSTGPRTAEGKAASSRNGLKHGLCADQHLLPGEDPEDFLFLLKDLYDRFHPVGQGEEKLVLRIAAAQWRLDRAFPIEAGIYRNRLREVEDEDAHSQRQYLQNKEIAEFQGMPLPHPPGQYDEADVLARAFDSDCLAPNSLAKLARYETSIEHSIERSLRQLKAFQAARHTPDPTPEGPQRSSKPAPEPPPTPSEPADCEPNPNDGAAPGVTPKIETLGKCTTPIERSVPSEEKRDLRAAAAGDQAEGSGPHADEHEHLEAMPGLGHTQTHAVRLAGGGIGQGGERAGQAAEPGARVGTGDRAAQGGRGGAQFGSGFFQRCLAKNMGTTVAELRGGRISIYEEIREMMRLQGKGRVERCCRLAGVSRAGFYRQWQAAEPAEEEQELRHQMQLIFVTHRGHYGNRRIAAQLRQQGMLVNKKRVARLMREDNLLAITQRKFELATTDSDHGLPVYLNLAARMVVTGINQLWVADITYIRLNREFVFLAVVIDVYSRRAIGRSISRRIDTQLTLAALKQAIQDRQPKPGVVHHNDQGVQYASRDYVAELLAHGLIPSMSRPGNPYDNAFCESFMKTLKKEEIYCNKYQDLEDLTRHAEEFIDEYYNRQRLHSALGYRSPADFEAAAAQAGGEANGLAGAPQMRYFTPPSDHNLGVTD